MLRVQSPIELVQEATDLSHSISQNQLSRKQPIILALEIFAKIMDHLCSLRYIYSTYEQ